MGENENGRGDMTTTNDGMCALCGGDVDRSADGLWYDGQLYRCLACGHGHHAVVSDDGVYLYPDDESDEEDES